VRDKKGGDNGEVSAYVLPKILWMGDVNFTRWLSGGERFFFPFFLFFF